MSATNLTAREAAELIADILDRVPDAQLPEARMDGDTAWFGSTGYVIGSGSRGGVPGPINHRRTGIHDLLCREQATRLEAEFWAVTR